MFSCKFAAYFQTTVFKNTSRCLLRNILQEEFYYFVASTRICKYYLLLLFILGLYLNIRITTSSSVICVEVATRGVL